MKPHLNLMPPALQWQLMVRRRVREWALRGMMLGILCAALLAASLHRLTAASQELDLWNRRAATIESIQESNRELSKQIHQIRQRLEKYHDVKSDHPGYQLLATISSSARSTAGELQIRKLSLREVTEELPASSTASPKQANIPSPRQYFVLSLTGAANSNLRVAQFATSLRDCGAFERVELKSSKGAPETRNVFTAYHIDCIF